MSAGATLPPLSSHTNDPQMANARVFIGNLPTEKAEKPLLYSIFKKYGEITGVSVHKGFAFVQYTCESDARDAVDCENGQEICGSYVDCKIASEGRSGVGSAPKNRSSSFKGATNGNTHLQRSDLSPPPRDRGGYDAPYDSPGLNYRSIGPYEPRDYSSMAPPPKSGSVPGDSYHQHIPPHRSPGFSGPPPSNLVGGAHSNPPFPVRESPLEKYQAEIVRERPFDCLIIATDKSIDDYLNYVTSSLKTTGGVNSHTIYYPVSTTSPITGPHMPSANFNNSEMKRMVDDVARLGCCPITIGPITFTNSVQRSLSVNIHYGKTLEEHRNMPLQDAIHLIVNSFAQYTEQERANRISPSALVSYPTAALSQLGHSSSNRDKEKRSRSKDIKDCNSASSIATNGSSSSSSSKDGTPQICRRAATLSEIIQQVLMSVEKTSALPAVTLDEIDQALELLHNTRNKLSSNSDGATPAALAPSAIPNSTITVSNHPQFVNLVHAVPPPSSAELPVSQSTSHAVVNTSNPSYVGGTVLNTGATLTYVATPAAIVSATPASAVAMETTMVATSVNENTRVVSANAAAPGTMTATFIHPQTTNPATAAIIGPATPCFIHDTSSSHATLQYHASAPTPPTAAPAPATPIGPHQPPQQVHASPCAQISPAAVAVSAASINGTTVSEAVVSNGN